MTEPIQVEGGQPKNFLRPCLLLLLAESPAHGYDLLERLSGFGFDREPGGLYRNLRSLEHEGLVTSAWEPSLTGPDRRSYVLTPAGGAWLDAWATTLAESRRLLDTFLTRHAEVRRAAPDTPVEFRGGSD